MQRHATCHGLGRTYLGLAGCSAPRRSPRRSWPCRCRGRCLPPGARPDVVTPRGGRCTLVQREQRSWLEGTAVLPLIWLHPRQELGADSSTRQPREGPQGHKKPCKSVHRGKKNPLLCTRARLQLEPPAWGTRSPLKVPGLPVELSPCSWSWLCSRAQHHLRSADITSSQPTAAHPAP